MESYSSLMNKRNALDRKIERARKAEVGAVVKRIRKAIEVYGITASQLFDAEKAVRRHIAKVNNEAKFTDGNGHSWTGVGRRPNWLVELMAKTGKPIDAFRAGAK
jgi:DNA-binding protein H-NS